MVAVVRLMASVSSLALPQISTPPEVRVPAGSAAMFPCMASGYPTPDIAWSKVNASQGTSKLPEGAGTRSSPYQGHQDLVQVWHRVLGVGGGSEAEMGDRP